MRAQDALEAAARRRDELRAALTSRRLQRETVRSPSPLSLSLSPHRSHSNLFPIARPSSSRHIVPRAGEG